MTQKSQILYAYFLAGCNSTVLRDDGPTGLALRSALADAAGLPLSSVLLLGAICTSDYTSIAFSPTDQANQYAGGVVLVRRLREQQHQQIFDHGLLGPVSAADVRWLQGDTAAAPSMLVSSQLSNIPSDSSNLLDSSTGIAAVRSINGMQNVQGRLNALAGSVSAEFLAAAAVSNVTIAVNSTAVASSISRISSAWQIASGSTGAVAVVAVAYGPTQQVTGSPRDLRWIAGPIIGEFVFKHTRVRAQTESICKYIYMHIYIQRQISRARLSCLLIYFLFVQGDLQLLLGHCTSTAFAIA